MLFKHRCLSSIFSEECSQPLSGRSSRKISEELGQQQSSVSHRGTENLVYVRVGGLSWSGCGPQGQPACHFQNTSSIRVLQAAPEAVCSTQARCGIPEQTVLAWFLKHKHCFIPLLAAKPCLSNLDCWQFTSRLWGRDRKPFCLS